MYVVAAYSVLEHVFVKFLGHAFGQGGYKHTLVALGAYGNLFQKVINLVLAGTDLNLRVKQAGWTDHLVHYNALALFKFVICRRGAYVYCLSRKFFELFKLERTVVQSSGQTESVLYQVFLAGAVTAVHGMQLGYAHVTLVNYHQEIFGKEIQQAVGTGAGSAAVKIA